MGTQRDTLKRQSGRHRHDHGSSRTSIGIGGAGISISISDQHKHQHIRYSVSAAAHRQTRQMDVTSTIVTDGGHIEPGQANITN